jgi:hypothetical protein
VTAGQAWLGTAAEHFADGEVELAAGHVDPRDDDAADVADGDLLAGALAADEAGAVVDVPPVVEQPVVADQAVDEVLLDLTKMPKLVIPVTTP